MSSSVVRIAGRCRRLRERDVLVERRVLVATRGLDRRDDLAGDVQLREVAEARLAVGPVVANSLVEPDGTLLNQVVGIASEEEVRRRLEPHESPITADQPVVGTPTRAWRVRRGNDHQARVEPQIGGGERGRRRRPARARTAEQHYGKQKRPPEFLSVEFGGANSSPGGAPRSRFPIGRQGSTFSSPLLWKSRQVSVVLSTPLSNARSVAGNGSPSVVGFTQRVDGGPRTAESSRRRRRSETPPSPGAGSRRGGRISLATRGRRPTPRPPSPGRPAR